MTDYNFAPYSSLHSVSHPTRFDLSSAVTMEYSDIKEEYSEPNEIDLMVKKEPITIKSERVRIKEEDIKPELDAVLKKGDGIGQANHVKEEYNELDLFPSCIDITTSVSNEFTNENQNREPEETPTLSPEECPENTCQQCEREFEDASSLKRHKNSLHSAKYHKCSLCNKEFRRQGSLYAHLKERHEDEIGKCENVMKFLLTSMISSLTQVKGMTKKVKNKKRK